MICRLFSIKNKEGCSVLSRSVVSDSVQRHGLYPARLLCPRGFSRWEYGVGCHAHLQGIFPTQGLSLSLPHCRWILYHLSHQGSCGKTSIIIQYKWWGYRVHCVVYLPVCLKFFIIEQFWYWSIRKCFFRGIRKWFFREIPTE